ncbi:MAG: TIGR00730 family Rossman fold protein, partial [Myxococcales bacterium]|nr:TIGR00730 family Rossman fold protein [Myxococcales bacterium]
MRRICVFCGSSLGADPAYVEAARALGALLCDEGIGLVYGGASVGLMGIVCDSVLARGGDAIGVLPRHLLQREVGHPR